MKLMGFPAEVDLDRRGAGDRPAAGHHAARARWASIVATRYTLTPDGDATTVRIDGEFTGAAVSLMAGKLKDSATAALDESLRKLAGLVA